jgi:hypothetical protein
VSAVVTFKKEIIVDQYWKMEIMDLKSIFLYGLFYCGFSTSDDIALNGIMIGKDLGETSRRLIKVLSRHLPGGPDKAMKDLSTLAEIQTKHLPNISLKYYWNINLLSTAAVL